jgi:hypothetical protein
MGRSRPRLYAAGAKYRDLKRGWFGLEPDLRRNAALTGLAKAGSFGKNQVNSVVGVYLIKK